LTGSSAFAAPSGLNVIPTADVLPAGGVSLETEFTGADLPVDGECDGYLLAQVGLGGGFEAGVDRCFDGSKGTWLNVKYRFSAESKGPPAFAAGIQNVGTGSDSQPYVAASKSLGGARVHFGMISIEDEVQGVLGLDRALSKQLTFQADYISGADNSVSIGGALLVGETLTLTAVRLISNSSSAENGYFLNVAWSSSWK